jgi:hypothetical protein
VSDGEISEVTSIEKEDLAVGHGRYRTYLSFCFEDESNPEARPKRKRRDGTKDKRNQHRMKCLQVGFIQEDRCVRWAVRCQRDWLLYAIFEHVFDLARFRGRYRGTALLFLWEIANDLGVSAPTVSRKLRRLEELGFIRFGRAKCDTFPNTLYILGYETKDPDSTDNTSTSGQNTSTIGS